MLIFLAREHWGRSLRETSQPIPCFSGMCLLENNRKEVEKKKKKKKTPSQPMSFPGFTSPRFLSFSADMVLCRAMRVDINASSMDILYAKKGIIKKPAS